VEVAECFVYKHTRARQRFQSYLLLLFWPNFPSLQVPVRYEEREEGGGGCDGIGEREREGGREREEREREREERVCMSV
jgi:hypothetical protein